MPLLPASMALITDKGDFDTITAYALGEERSKPLIYIIRELFDILSGDTERPSIFIDDITILEDILSST